MKKILFLFFATVLFSKTLPLSVKYDPFSKTQEIINKTAKKRVSNSEKHHFNLKVYAIYNNKVFINSKFYKTGDMIYGYKVYKIGKNYVILKRKNRFKVVNLVKNGILKIRKKR